MKNNRWVTRAYIFILFLLLPMDWFVPTGDLFREFGAKPVIPFLVLGSGFIFFSNPSAFFRMNKVTFDSAFLLAFIFLLGSMSFWINLWFSWSDFGQAKNPIIQFVAQSGLFALFACVMVVHARLFEHERWRNFALTILPIVVIIHLAVFFLEAGGFLSHATSWLAMFRPKGTTDLGRPSGLMSEPSYFGMFAALYGFPLLVVESSTKKSLRYVLAGALFASAILIRAKTFVPVIGLEFMIFIWIQGRSAIRFKYALLALFVFSVSIYLIIANAAFDLQENLSSVNRIGSTVVALNASADGYGLTGIGFGQFHFFYRPEFAPNYIFASKEALKQMAGSSDTRASTFNLYARFLIETGVLGLSLFLWFLYRIIRNIRRDKRPATLFGLVFIAGSLGFLCTQDTYFYPPLVVGLAFLLGISSELSVQKIHPHVDSEII